ncbi:unnamed protein product [Porites lobata]|uniref:Uncharacterized protein n=1 Tax=Porites lobata TaxID=104759 RepID=A0ABN8PKI4_9CNID|nr:unnamed protein product [Porites lobata]
MKCKKRTTVEYSDEPVLDTVAKYDMIVELANCFMKGYHEFGIKLPVAARTTVERKVGGRDEFALLGRVPHDLSEEMLNKTMHSRSLKKSYQVRDVIGKPIGRVQYFLNRTLVEEMTRGNISEIEGRCKDIKEASNDTKMETQ